MYEAIIFVVFLALGLNTPPSGVEGPHRFTGFESAAQCSAHMEKFGDSIVEHEAQEHGVPAESIVILHVCRFGLEFSKTL